MSSPTSASPTSSTDSDAQRARDSSRPDALTRLARFEFPVVLVVWALMSALAWHFVESYASSIPFQDDTELIAALLPGAKLDWHFWWVPANEHRIVIPRAIYMAL